MGSLCISQQNVFAYSWYGIFLYKSTECFCIQLVKSKLEVLKCAYCYMFIICKVFHYRPPKNEKTWLQVSPLYRYTRLPHFIKSPWRILGWPPPHHNSLPTVSSFTCCFFTTVCNCEGITAAPTKPKECTLGGSMPRGPLTAHRLCPSWKAACAKALLATSRVLSFWRLLHWVCTSAV